MTMRVLYVRMPLADSPNNNAAFEITLFTAQKLSTALLCLLENPAITAAEVFPVGVQNTNRWVDEYGKPTEPPGPTASGPTLPSGTDAARAVLSPAATPVHTPPPAAASAPALPEMRERWARDRKGNEQAFPQGAESFEVTITKTERKDLESGSPRLKVSWQSPSGRGYVTASCFDEKLFPWICGKLKQGKTLMYTTKNGSYLNIVGIRA